MDSIPLNSRFLCKEVLHQSVFRCTVLSVALVTWGKVGRSLLLYCPQLQIHINMWEVNPLCHTPHLSAEERGIREE